MAFYGHSYSTATHNAFATLYDVFDEGKLTVASLVVLPRHFRRDNGILTSLQE